MAKFLANDDYVARLTSRLAAENPNDSSTEDWDADAIQDLANYLEATDYPDPDHIASGDEPPYYLMYDLLKWTRSNG